MSTPAAAPHLTSPLSSLRVFVQDRIGIGHALVDKCSSHEALSAIIAYARSGGPPAYVLTPNAQHVVLLDTDPQLREIYRTADLVVPDGISLLLAARIFGRSLPERVAGVDLFQGLCKLAAEAGLSVFLLGGRPGSAELAASHLRSTYRDLQVRTYCPPLNFENDPSELSRIDEKIQRSRPHLVFVAFGAPKQEYWIHRYGRKLQVPVCIGVGGSFEMVAGVVQRAPVWIQRLGCEWLFRFCAEPRRMWRRYLIGNLQFASIVFHQRIRRAVLSGLVKMLSKSSFAAELEDTLVQTRTLELMSRLASFQSTTTND